MSDTEPRAWTSQEMREMFLSHLIALTQHWAALPSEYHRGAFGLPPIPPGMEDEVSAYMKYVAEGVLHSTLVTLDGGSMRCPAMDLVPAPHEDDKQYLIDQGENYWEPVVINECQLHDEYNARGRK